MLKKRLKIRFLLCENICDFSSNLALVLVLFISLVNIITSEIMHILLIFTRTKFNSGDALVIFNLFSEDRRNAKQYFKNPVYYVEGFL